MKKLLIIFSVLFALLLREECHGQGTVKYTAGISYGVGDPTYTPQGNVSKKYINLATLRSSTYSGASWVLDGRGIDFVSGCAAPAYTPGPGQSNIVINNCTLLQNGQGPELYVHDGTSWIFINEKSTAPTYTAGTGINIAGTVISNTAPDQVVSITGAGINAVTGTYPNFTVTGTEVDGSVTNELQTLSISNDTLSISDGNSVVLPGGGVTWPLRGPDGSAASPSYSFESDTLAGMYKTNRGLEITGKEIKIQSYSGEDGGGNFNLLSGESSVNAGGNFYAKSGFGASAGGEFQLRAGNSDNQGGNFSMAAGDGVTGGSFTMNAGSSTVGDGGAFGIYSGYGENGGSFSMYASDGSINGGSFIMASGNGDTYGGSFDIVGGDGYGSPSTGGSININAGGGEEGGVIGIKAGNTTGSGYKKVTITGGTGATFGAKGNIKIDYAIEYTPITLALRDSNTPTAGKTIFCSNCTANDSSTGVLQTYNGSAWKNHW